MVDRIGRGRFRVETRFAAGATGIAWVMAVVALWQALTGMERDAVTNVVRPAAFAGVATLFALLWWRGAGSTVGRRVGATVLGASMVGTVVVAAIGLLAFWMSLGSTA